MVSRNDDDRGTGQLLNGPRLHYAWIVLAVTFVCLLTAAAVRSLPGILMHSLEAEFGWNRAAIGFAVSINVLLFGWIFCAHQVGAALAAYGAGLLHVWFGDCTLSFLLAGGLALLGSGLACGIGERGGRKPAPTHVIPAGPEPAG